MRDSIKWVANRMPKSDDRQLSIMSLGNVAKARFFHSSFPQYSITPLARLDGMAKYLGLGDLFVKDESFRFGLNASRCWAAPSPWPGTSPRRWAGTSAR